MDSLNEAVNGQGFRTTVVCGRSYNASLG